MNAFAPHSGALDLSGAWRLESGDGGMAAAIALPGDVHFSDNAFDILPGEAVAVIFTPDDPATAVDVAAFVVRDLHSSYASRSI